MTQAEGQLAYRWQRDFDKQGAMHFKFLFKQRMHFLLSKSNAADFPFSAYQWV